MPRRDGAHPIGHLAAVRPTQSPAQGQRRRPQRPPGDLAGNAGPPNVPRHHAPARAVPPTAISAANSTARCPSGRGAPGPRARQNPEPANLAGGYGPSRANRASSHRRSGVSVRRRSTPRVSARSGSAADSTTISRSRIRSTRRRGRVARRTIRCHACATAELTTRTAGWSTARGPGHRRAQPPGAVTPGITTTDRGLMPTVRVDQARGGRISRGRANTNVSLAVVTGCTVP